MWSYVTYLAVGNNVYNTFGMLVPWMLLCGYIRQIPSWSYTGSVAAFTPVVINLGRLPYGDSIPASNYALLRIEENLVGISIGVVLTILIFPVFAVDVLKENINKTLITCKDSIRTIHTVYDQLLLHTESHPLNSNTFKINIAKESLIGAFLSQQFSKFQKLIGAQYTLITQASIEPTFWLNKFSTTQYKALITQQIDIFRMLHNIDTSLIRISETCSDIERLQQIGLIPNLHSEICQITGQLGDCVDLWSKYFTMTQSICNCKRQKTDTTVDEMQNIQQQQQQQQQQSTASSSQSDKKLHPDDYILEHEERLISLHSSVRQLYAQHQLSLNNLLSYLLEKLKQEDHQTLAQLLPHTTNDDMDAVIVALTSLFYSITHLINAVIMLGTGIHTIFELETTNIYRKY
ncbi:unnamed protein product [Didymodactylos carnosus]|uniref:Uncharacterized protein n=1 Tax=Didymodactylos carnosus TaxID=1234261 RepID=A0A8S2UA33_9BILA|nr:unnamed protein product [Didymodactylos carnosus]CAF4326710.1 unnamed protein product [Didymodactylos carnosus]